MQRDTPKGPSISITCPVYCVLIKINTKPTIKPPMQPYHLFLNIKRDDKNMITIQKHTQGLIALKLPIKPNTIYSNIASVTGIKNAILCMTYYPANLNLLRSS